MPTTPQVGSPEIPKVFGGTTIQVIIKLVTIVQDSVIVNACVWHVQCSVIGFELAVGKSR